MSITGPPIKWTDFTSYEVSIDDIYWTDKGLVIGDFFYTNAEILNMTTEYKPDGILIESTPIEFIGVDPIKNPEWYNPIKV